MNRILIAGIGNIFMGDDGFGSEVAQKLARAALPADVDLVDFGIRGMDLGYALMDGYDTAILIDTVDRGSAPGTVHVIEPEFEDLPADMLAAGEMIAPHAMDPARVLRLVASLGDRRPHVLLVGCQPQTLGGDAGHMGLSTVVAAAVERAVTDVLAIIDGLTRDGPACRRELEQVSA